MTPRAPTEPGNLEGDVRRLEWQHEQMEGRLREGAKTFAAIEERINRPWPLWTVLGMGSAAVAFVGALIWQAARYPERDEFDRVQDRQHEMKFEQQAIRGEVKSIAESQKRTEGALESVGKKLDDMATRRKADPIGRTKPRPRRSR